MSLVDYDASSSDDDESIPIFTKPKTTSHIPLPQINSESNLKPESSNLSIEKLPDASELLNSASFSSGFFSGTEKSPQSPSRKRVSMSSSLPRIGKVAKGTLPRSRNVLDTAGQVLVPPQLKGRSNVVTEDITKLFVKRKAEAAKNRVSQVGDT